MTERCALNVLVLGVGGNIGQGILKAIRASSLPCRIVGACVTPLAAGLYVVDKAYISPLAVEDEFRSWLFDVCRREAIHAVLCGVEPVLEVMSVLREDLKSDTGAVCIVSDPESLRIGNDKLRTCQWLESQGLAFPRYALSTDCAAVEQLAAAAGFPLIAKPRHGKGSQGIIHIADRSELAFLSSRPDYVIQEYLGNPQEEYTAGVFVDREGDARGAITMRRDLLEGTSFRMEVGSYAEIREEAISISRALRPMGPCNIQLRMHQGRAVCFEINVRFSGTTPVRAHFGFNEVDASLRHYVLGQPAEDLPVVTEGVALRYWNELYVPARAVDAVRSGHGAMASMRPQIDEERFKPA